MDEVSGAFDWLVRYDYNILVHDIFGFANIMRLDSYSQADLHVEANKLAAYRLLYEIEDVLDDDACYLIDEFLVGGDDTNPDDMGL
ncbi:hypothetical protein [Nocardia neocaledoniensis]|uniref:hypothetical protein n=1 Tax=Nocardia neocaledoniensis TaxID=236511 RepID=UPI002458CFDF|nr:hypothetical protein [Nocardia neocaledoniensis]